MTKEQFANSAVKELSGKIKGVDGPAKDEYIHEFVSKQYEALASELISEEVFKNYIQGVYDGIEELQKKGEHNESKLV